MAKTGPIELEVSPSKILTDADMEGRDFTAVNKEVEAIKKGLSANYEDLDALTNQTFSPLAAVISPDYAVIWAGPLALLLLSALIKFSTHTTPEKVAAKRRRSAAGKAIGRLRKIAPAATQQRAENLASVMKQYVGDRFDKTARSLTSEDCFGIITEAAKDTQTAERYQEIIANYEAVRYTSIEANIDSAQIKEVKKLVRMIEKKSKK